MRATILSYLGTGISDEGAHPFKLKPSRASSPSRGHRLMSSAPSATATDIDTSHKSSPTPGSIRFGFIRSPEFEGHKPVSTDSGYHILESIRSGIGCRHRVSNAPEVIGSQNVSVQDVDQEQVRATPGNDR